MGVESQSPSTPQFWRALSLQALRSFLPQAAHSTGLALQAAQFPGISPGLGNTKKARRRGVFLGARQPLPSSLAHTKRLPEHWGLAVFWNGGGKTHRNSKTQTAIFRQSYHSPLSPTFLHNPGVSEKANSILGFVIPPRGPRSVSQHVSFSTGSRVQNSRPRSLSLQPVDGENNFPAHHESQVEFSLPSLRAMNKPEI